MEHLVRLETSLELRFANLVKGSNAADDNRLPQKSNENPSVAHSSAFQLNSQVVNETNH